MPASEHGMEGERATDSSGIVCDAPEFVRRRIARALRERVRYRYVHPEVFCVAEGWKIVSPCCSRSVDEAGGTIDIALIRRIQADFWTLAARDREADCWCTVDSGARVDELLSLLCADPLRIFWP
ncbi:hypothetical protein [Niveibacterium terrae]|uniref:DUF3024 domain-containing protein n=1 Tax=Niveibacterium terrae TaxID=3373598 RepID=UPI003A925D97